MKTTVHTFEMHDLSDCLDYVSKECFVKVSLIKINDRDIAVSR